MDFKESDSVRAQATGHIKTSKFQQQEESQMKAGDAIIEAARKQAEGEVAVHKANIIVYQTMPAGIGEHSDIVEAVIEELNKLAEADDRLEMINKYFPK